MHCMSRSPQYVVQIQFKYWYWWWIDYFIVPFSPCLSFEAGILDYYTIMFGVFLFHSNWWCARKFIISSLFSRSVSVTRNQWKEYWIALCGNDTHLDRFLLIFFLRFFSRLPNFFYGQPRYLPLFVQINEMRRNCAQIEMYKNRTHESKCSNSQ